MKLSFLSPDLQAQTSAFFHNSWLHNPKNLISGHQEANCK